MKKINVLSLFDGMSCGQQALDKANIPVEKYYASEVEPASMSVTRYNYPDTVFIGDVKAVDVNSLPFIDLIIGGSPCQGFSFAGKQLNFEDPRSQLFFEFVRLLEGINPKYFFLENVKMKKEYETVITELLGVDPVFINSELVSPQLRGRLYWTNIPFNSIPDRVDISLSDIIKSSFVNRDKSYCVDANYYKGGNLKSYFKSSRRQLVFHSESTFHQSLDNLENGLIKIKDLARPLSPVEAERIQGLPDNYTLCDGVPKSHRYHMVGNGWSIPVIKHFFQYFVEPE